MSLQLSPLEPHTAHGRMTVERVCHRSRLAQADRHGPALATQSRVADFEQRLATGACLSYEVRDGSEALCVYALDERICHPVMEPLCVLAADPTESDARSLLDEIARLVLQDRPTTVVEVGIPREYRFRCDREVLSRAPWQLQEWFWVGCDLRSRSGTKVGEPVAVLGWSEGLPVLPEAFAEYEAKLFLTDERFDPALSLKAVAGMELVGFILGLDGGDGDLVTTYLYVVPAWRRQGIAKQLKGALLDKAQAMGYRHALTILHRANTAAWALNAASGYQVVCADGVRARREA